MECPFCKMTFSNLKSTANGREAHCSMKTFRPLWPIYRKHCACSQLAKSMKIDPYCLLWPIVGQLTNLIESFCVTTKKAGFFKHIFINPRLIQACIKQLR